MILTLRQILLVWLN